MNFKEIANSGVGKSLVKFIEEEVQAKVADIRYKPEINNDTRMAVIEILDEMIVDKIKVLRGDKEPHEGTDDYK